MVREARFDLSNPQRLGSTSTGEQGPSGSIRKENNSNATTGAAAAGVRALSARLVAFYFRAPVKAFFRTRVDYLAFTRAINPRVQANEAWSWRMTTPGLLGHAIRTYGWGFIPKQVLPPLVANVAVGTVLYTSYLTILSSIHGPSSEAIKRVYPPPPPSRTFAAGFAAGSIQSLAAAPLDALQCRFQMSDMLEGRYNNMWQYGRQKLKSIGVCGVFSGWSLSLCKESMGYGVFFATFEYVKAQGFYSFVTSYYGHLQPLTSHLRRGPDGKDGTPTLKPHFAVEPTFLLLAGMSASVAQQIVQFPLGLVQEIHYGRLQSLDFQAQHSPRWQMMGNYRTAYRRTFEECQAQAKRVGGWRKWIYRGFFVSTLRQIPSTSAGLVIFELVRRRYASEAEAVRIEKDGYDILLG